MILEILVAFALLNYFKYPDNELMPTAVFFIGLMCLVQVGSCARSLGRWFLAVIDPDAWIFRDPIMLSREAVNEIYLKSQESMPGGIITFADQLEAYAAGKHKAEVQAARFFCTILLGEEYDESEHRRKESFLSFRR